MSLKGHMSKRISTMLKIKNCFLKIYVFFEKKWFLSALITALIITLLLKYGNLKKNIEDKAAFFQTKREVKECVASNFPLSEWELEEIC